MAHRKDVQRGGPARHVQEHVPSFVLSIDTLKARGEGSRASQFKHFGAPIPHSHCAQDAERSIDRQLSDLACRVSDSGLRSGCDLHGPTQYGLEARTLPHRNHATQWRAVPASHPVHRGMRWPWQGRHSRPTVYVALCCFSRRCTPAPACRYLTQYVRCPSGVAVMPSGSRQVPLAQPPPGDAAELQPGEPLLGPPLPSHTLLRSSGGLTGSRSMGAAIQRAHQACPPLARLQPGMIVRCGSRTHILK